MVQKYQNEIDIRDEREFSFGEVWKVRDELISLLPTDRMKWERNIHFGRTVVIVDNCLENNDKESVLIRVAPLAHQIQYQWNFDVLLYPPDEFGINDGVDKKCMCQVHLAQPILKKDLFEKVCEISSERKSEIAAVFIKQLRLDSILLGETTALDVTEDDIYDEITFEDIAALEE